MAALLDVNALIALIDAGHVAHEAMHQWFAAYASEGWATCPLTENGLVRVITQPAYTSGPRTPAEAIEILRLLKKNRQQDHEFWTDDISLSDASIFLPAHIIGPGQVTDAYLLGLAMKRAGKVVSLDRSMPWQAIRNGSKDLVVSPIR